MRRKEIAATKQVTPAQLALVWLGAEGEGHVPIPGTKRRKNLEERTWPRSGSPLRARTSSGSTRPHRKARPSGERYEDMSAVNR